MTRRRVVDARLHLLSRQVVDVDGVPVTTVDDLEILGDDGDVQPGRPAHVEAILTGPVLITRIFGGTPPRSRWERIPWRHVGYLAVNLRLTVRADSLDLDWTEQWLRKHLIGRIPGGQADPEEEQ